MNPSARIKLAPGMRSDQVVMYSTNSPLLFSESMSKRICVKRFRTVGIGIQIPNGSRTDENSYFIILIFM
jgi:hypothetical protein